MSVVFDFNASLNDVAPLSPMPFSVDVNRNEERIGGFLLCAFFCIHYSDRAQ